jgi:LmbE family N-acetylglucosaminyl deacetylase
MDTQYPFLATDWNSALVVVPHPDDIEFGAAGAVAAWTAAGKSVRYLLLTRGEAGIDGMPPEEAAKVREREQRDSAAIVGVEQVEFLDYADGTIEATMDLRRTLVGALRRHRPELVVGFNHHDRYLSGRWNHPDHRAAGRALLDAVGDCGNRWVHTDIGPEPWTGIKHVVIANSAQPTHAVDITDTFDLAVRSLAAHKAYLDGLNPPVTDVRGPLAAMAGGVGERAGVRYAVAFEEIPR